VTRPVTLAVPDSWALGGPGEQGQGCFCQYLQAVLLQLHWVLIVAVMWTDMGAEACGVGCLALTSSTIHAVLGCIPTGRRTCSRHWQVTQQRLCVFSMTRMYTTRLALGCRR
jgi:hypothetical protein